MSEVVIEGGEILWVPVSVTTKHIADGKQATCGACPYALAANGVLITGVYTEIFPGNFEIWSQGHNRLLYEHPLTGEPSKKIAAYDLNGAMKPHAAMLPIPAYLLRPEVAQAAKHLELERAESKCGLTRAEEAEEAAMRG